jgi:hypothetical protein
MNYQLHQPDKIVMLAKYIVENAGKVQSLNKYLNSETIK